MGTNHGVPTRYLGIQFRSRLEARWAAWFSLVGWQWQYEPIELDGYIPDFLVEHPATEWLAAPAAPGVPLTTRRLVEVKPVTDQLLLTDHVDKIEASGWDGPIAIVGATPWDYTVAGHGAELGIQRCVDGARVGWGPWVMAPRSLVFKAWREAGNLTQWRGARAVD